MSKKPANKNDDDLSNKPKIKKVGKSVKIESSDEEDEENEEINDQTDEILEDNTNESEENDDSDDDVSMVKIQTIKKRGRPKKMNEKITSEKSKSEIKNNEKRTKQKDDELILHLQIFDDDTNSKDTNSKNANSKDTNSSDQNHFTVEDSDKKNANSGLFSDYESVEDSSNDDNASDYNIRKMKKEMKVMSQTIKNLRAELAKCKSDRIAMNNWENNIKTIDLKLFNRENGKLIVVDKTDVACWWCAHNFDTLPCFIPDRFNDHDGSYYVFGCFCTYSCALAYNLNMGEDSRRMTRHSLIKKMYRTVFNRTDELIESPKRERLKKFGGDLSIDDFRNHALLCQKEFKIHIPPSIPLLAIIEDVPKDASGIIIPLKINQTKQRGKKLENSN